MTQNRLGIHVVSHTHDHRHAAALTFFVGVAVVELSGAFRLVAVESCASTMTGGASTPLYVLRDSAEKKARQPRITFGSWLDLT